MSLTARLVRAFRRTRSLPAPLRYATTAGIVLIVFLARHLVQPQPGQDYPLGHFLLAVLLSSALFDRGAGFLALALSALLGAYVHLPLAGYAASEGLPILTLTVFLVVGTAIALVTEALHRALARLDKAHEELGRSERARTLLLKEFHHRTRNDLNSLIGLLLLRARTAPSEAAREALREAAGHALTLARVQARLTPDQAPDGEASAWVDTQELVTGLCAELEAELAGEGLRPVALLAEAEAHRLDAERAIPLGLVLNETVTSALKYAFPEDRAGTVHVRFRREGAHFLLTVTDDGVGLPVEAELAGAPPARAAEGAGLGTRLLRALATQLRGSFTRCPGERGIGTSAELRFPVRAPGPAAR